MKKAIGRGHRLSTGLDLFRRSDGFQEGSKGPSGCAATCEASREERMLDAISVDVELGVILRNAVGHVFDSQLDSCTLVRDGHHNLVVIASRAACFTASCNQAHTTRSSQSRSRLCWFPRSLLASLYRTTAAISFDKAFLLL